MASTAHWTEPSANAALGRRLGRMLPSYTVLYENTRQIVEQLPAAEAAQFLTNLRSTVEDVAATGANQAHDLTGRIFQRLIADRKYLATFYTLPASAALLARLAVSKMDVDWSDAEAIGNLKIGDFACGTGALLSAVYEQIATKHESTGGDLAALHPVMMEEVLYGCDVIPSAFAALVDRKLKAGGVLAMVLPLLVSAGLSWKGFRELFGGSYADLTVLSIAANGKEMSFSSDTGMAECLVIARVPRRRRPQPRPSSTAVWSVICSDSTRVCTRPSEGYPPSGARSRRCTGGRRGRGVLYLSCNRIVLDIWTDSVLMFNI